MPVTYFSNRIYKNTLAEEVSILTETLSLFNRAKHFAYREMLYEFRLQHTSVTEEVLELQKSKPSIHMRTKTKYKINDYITNSAVQDAKAILKSQKELNQMYIKDLKHQISSSKKKITRIKKSLQPYKKLQDQLIDGKPLKLSNFRALEQEGESIIHHCKNHSEIYKNTYDFEYIFLKPYLKNKINRRHMIEKRISNLEKKLDNRKNMRFNGVIFGSRKMFMSQYTTDIEHSSWMEDFHKERYTSMRVSGRKDAKYGNFVFKYQPESTELNICLPENLLTIKGLVFPYGQDKVDAAIKLQIIAKKPIAWEIKDHGDYYIFKVTIEAPKNEEINYSLDSGVIGIDINVDHLAWANITADGNLLDHGTIAFDVSTKTSGQTIKILEKVAIGMLSIAEEKKKPIVLEKLNLQNKKSQLRYKKKHINKKISQFAYEKIQSSLKSRAKKVSVAVFEVNPAYSSIIGKYKYMKAKGLSIHESAAYVIARRSKIKKEQVPPRLFSLLPEKIINKHHWTHWNYVNKALTGINPHALYKLSSCPTLSSFDEMKGYLIKSSKTASYGTYLVSV